MFFEPLNGQLLILHSLRRFQRQHRRRQGDPPGRRGPACRGAGQRSRAHVRHPRALLGELELHACRSALLAALRRRGPGDGQRLCYDADEEAQLSDHGG